MKFKGIVLGLLAAILVVNTVMAGILITEAKEQTKYTQATTEIIAAVVCQEIKQTDFSSIYIIMEKAREITGNKLLGIGSDLPQ